MFDIMNIQSAILDMDGTLIDSLADLTDSVNETMTHYNFPTHTLEEYRYFVGNGARKLIERSVPQNKSKDADFVNEVLEYYNGCYERHLTNKTKPYDGIVDLLDKLKAQNTFDAVIGDKHGMPRKPDPTKVLKIASDFKVDPQFVAYFGDTSVDMETAHNAGFLSVGVTWGFRPVSELKESGAQIIINQPNEIWQYIEFENIRQN